MNQNQEEPVPRVKPKKEYVWTQDSKYVRVRLDIPNTTINQILVEVAEVVLKVNVTDRKYVKLLDLWGQVKCQGGQVVYTNNVLEVVLIKAVEQEWPTLLMEEMDKQQLIQRRQEAWSKKEEEEKQYYQSVKDLKQELDTHSTREQMRMDDLQRKRINDVKQQEKSKALTDLYESLDQTSAFKSEPAIPQATKPSKQAQREQIGNDDELEIEEKIKRYEQFVTQEQGHPRKQPQKPIQAAPKVEKAIFEDRDLVVEQTTPQVRTTSGAIQLPFTERIYPNLAAREQHFKDAPLPNKNKKYSKDERDNNPLFLKDKGDEFFANKDFYSAINAYTMAFKGNNQLVTCLANRSASFLSLYNFKECLQDCDAIIELFTKDPQEKYQMIYWKSLLRKGICYSWKGNLEEAKNIFSSLITILEQAQHDKKEAIVQQAHEAINLIELRIKSHKLKLQGDHYFRQSSLQKALDLYKQSYEIDQNELALANAGLIFMKQNLVDQSLTATEQVIERVQSFIRYGNQNPMVGKQSFQESNEFLLKLYMRQSKCFSTKQMLHDAHQAIKMAINIDEQNTEARSILSQIQKLQTKQEALQTKQEATDRLKAGKIEDALTLFNECLKKLTAQDDLFELLAVLLNRCICCFHLQQFEEIVGTCVRGLKLITQQKNKVLSFEKQSKEDKAKLNDYQVRFLVRRSNSYIKLNQIYHARCDLEEALKLDPTNNSIQLDLDKLKNLS